MWLVLSLVLLPWYIVVMPALHVPDELHHLYRAYSIADGAIVNERRGTEAGDTVPESLRELKPLLMDGIVWDQRGKITSQRLGWALAVPLRPARTVFVDFRNTVLHSPLAYVPQVTAILAGKPFLLRPLGLVYFGRLLAYVTFVGCVYLALRLLPGFRWVTLLVAGTPMMVHQAASLSADSVTNSLSLLFVALIVRALMIRGPLPRWHAAAIVCTGALLGACKPSSLAIVGLVCLAASAASGDRRRARPGLSMCVATIMAALVSAGLWSWAVEGVRVPMYGSDPAGQLAFVTGSPVRYAYRAAVSFVVYGTGYLEGLVGYFGWLDTKLPLWLCVLYSGAILGFAALAPGRSLHLSLGNRLFILATVGGSVLLIQFVMFLACAPHPKLIVGVQGRYFLPLLLPLAMACTPPFRAAPRAEQTGAQARWFTSPRPVTTAVIAVGLLVVVHVTSYVLLVQRYY